MNSWAKATELDTPVPVENDDNESHRPAQDPGAEDDGEDQAQGPAESKEGLRVEQINVIELKTGELLQVNQDDRRALEEATPDEAVLPSCMPPEKLSKGAIQKRLWRIVQPKANGQLKVPQELVDEYKDESTRKNVMSLFEKSGYQRDWFWGWTKVLNVLWTSKKNMIIISRIRGYKIDI